MPPCTTTVRWNVSATSVSMLLLELSGFSYANDGVGADQLNKIVLDSALGVAIAVDSDVSEVTDVTLLVAWGAVGLAVGVDCSHRVRSGQAEIH